MHVFELGKIMFSRKLKRFMGQQCARCCKKYVFCRKEQDEYCQAIVDSKSVVDSDRPQESTEATDSDQKEKKEPIDEPEELPEELKELSELYEKYCTFADSADEKDINLTKFDKWFTQAGLFKKGNIRKADTAVHFTKIAKHKKKITIKEFGAVIQSLCAEKEVPVSEIKDKLMAAGPPAVTGTTEPIRGTAAAENMERLTDPSHFTGVQKEQAQENSREQQEKTHKNPEQPERRENLNN